MSTLSQLQQEILEAEEKVNALRKQLEEEKKTERAQAIAAARELIKSHGLTASELGFSGKTSSNKSASKRAALEDRRVSVAPKYQDPSTGKTWTGRGKTPVWLANYISVGRAKTDFLIK